MDAVLAFFIGLITGTIISWFAYICHMWYYNRTQKQQNNDATWYHTVIWKK